MNGKISEDALDGATAIIIELRARVAALRAALERVLPKLDEEEQALISETLRKWK